MILAAFSIWPLVVFAYNNPKLLLAGLATLIVLMILTWLARSWRMAILAATVAACLIWQGVEFKAGYDAREQITNSKRRSTTPSLSVCVRWSARFPKTPRPRFPPMSRAALEMSDETTNQNRDRAALPAHARGLQ